MPFFEKIKKHIVHLLSCCDSDKAEPVMKIGHPTDFRRGDVTIEALLSFDQQASIYEKATSDARLPPSPVMATFPHLSQQPLCPSVLDRAVQHGRKLSARFHPYLSVYGDVNGPCGSGVMLKDCGMSMEHLEQDGYGVGVGGGKGSFDEQRIRGVEWADRDSVTLGGSERDGSEKGGSSGVVRCVG